MTIEEMRALANEGKEIAEKATAGPWQQHEFDDYDGWVSLLDDDDYDPDDIDCDHQFHQVPKTIDDAELMAKSRELVPALSAALLEACDKLETLVGIQAAVLVETEAANHEMAARMKELERDAARKTWMIEHRAACYRIGPDERDGGPNFEAWVCEYTTGSIFSGQSRCGERDATADAAIDAAMEGKARKSPVVPEHERRGNDDGGEW